MSHPNDLDGNPRDIAGPHAMEFGWGTKIILGALLCLAIFSAAGTVLSNVDGTARDASSQAQTNRSTCLSALAANGRFAVDVLGVLITTPKGQQIDAPIARKMGLPRDVKSAAVTLRARFAAVALDDKRIGNTKDPICPFRPGSPSGTPTRPVDSETAKLEAKLRRTGHP